MHPYDKKTITAGGRRFMVEYFYDNDSGKPWIENDGHGVIRETSCRYGRPEKKPGEYIMHCDGGYYWIYDIQATTKQARADAWGITDPAPGMSRRQITAAAVARDMEYCADYIKGNWHYCGIVVTLINPDGEKSDTSDSLWGLESNDDAYIQETAGGMADVIIDQLREAWRAELREARERKYWNSRDVVTS